MGRTSNGKAAEEGEREGEEGKGRRREDEKGSVGREGEGLFLFFSRPRSEGWPHHGRTFSIYPYPLSF